MKTKWTMFVYAIAFGALVFCMTDAFAGLYPYSAPWPGPPAPAPANLPPPGELENPCVAEYMEYPDGPEEDREGVGEEREENEESFERIKRNHLFRGGTWSDQDLEAWQVFQTYQAIVEGDREEAQVCNQ